MEREAAAKAKNAKTMEKVPAFAGKRKGWATGPARPKTRLARMPFATWRPSRQVSVLATLNIVPNPQRTPVRHFESFSGSPFRSGALGEASPHRDHLAEISFEILPLDPAALQISHRHCFEAPRAHLIIGLFEIHVEI